MREDPGNQAGVFDSGVIFNRSPHSQRSVSKTRLSNRAQLMRADWPWVLTCLVHGLGHPHEYFHAVKCGNYG